MGPSHASADLKAGSEQMSLLDGAALFATLCSAELGWVFLPLSGSLLG